MDLGTRDTLLTLGSGILLLAGIVLVVIGETLLAVIGIVLIVLSAIIFIVDTKDLLVKIDERRRGE